MGENNPELVEEAVAWIRELMETARADTRLSIMNLIERGRHGLGGTLVLQAPLSSAKDRSRWEANFRSERFALT